MPAAANRTVPMLLPFFFRSKSVCAVAAVPALTYESVGLATNVTACVKRDEETIMLAVGAPRIEAQQMGQRGHSDELKRGRAAVNLHQFRACARERRRRVGQRKKRRIDELQRRRARVHARTIFDPFPLYELGVSLRSRNDGTRSTPRPAPVRYRPPRAHIDDQHSGDRARRVDGIADRPGVRFA